MFTLDDITAIQKRAAEGNWPFPYLFNSLKALGVDRYEVNVLTHETRFVGMGGSVAAPAPEGWTALEAGEFDAAGVRRALARVQARETDYGQFLREIAAAGISFYRVDMKPRTVTYHGAGRHKIVEPVPDTKAV